MTPRNPVSSSSQSASSSPTWRQRWEHSWWNTPLYVRDTPLSAPVEGLKNFCAIPRDEWRSIAATATLVVFLLGQCVLPATLLLPYARAAEPQKGQSAVAVDTNAKSESKGEQDPLWIKQLRARIAKDKQERAARLARTANQNPALHPRVQTVQAPLHRELTLSDLIRVPPVLPDQVELSEDNGDSEDSEVDVRSLDLSRTPTERELRRAGQMGGALSPTRPAEPLEVEGRLDAILKYAGIEAGLKANLPEEDPFDAKRDRAGKLLAHAKKKAKRVRLINLAFGAAMQEWNTHNYAVAAKMFEKYIEEFPESPWVGEAILHLGCDAKYNGRFSEAQEHYETLLNDTSGKKPSPDAQARRPMRARSQSEALDRLKEQVDYIIEHAKTPEEAVEHVEETTDLSFDIHQKAKLRWADLDMAMGRFDSAGQKLANILQTDTDWRRKTWAGHWLRNTNFYKHNAAMLMACGPRSLGLMLASLGQQKAAARVREAVAPRATGFNLAELESLAAKNGVLLRGFKIKTGELSRLPLPAILHYDFGNKSSRARSDERGEATLFRPQIGIGHFVVLQSVDVKAKKVQVYDALEHRVYSMTFPQLQRQWSGKGLAPRKGRTHLAKLDAAEMKKAVGGCCGVPSKEDDLGDSPNNQDCRNCGGDQGEPVVEINRATLNMYVHDTPLWYQPAKGPSVGLTISHNSQEALNQNDKFGKKWMFNFGCYAVQDSAGQVIVFMPDGSKDKYNIINGVYTGEAGNFTKLTKPSANFYLLTFQDGSKWEFKLPAATGSDQVFLTKVTDRFGYSLTLAYDQNVRLSTITDADGKVTTFFYNSGGRVSSVWDPFQRHADFSYDTNGNLVQCTDMDGHLFSYVYDSLSRITKLNTAQGPWLFYHEAPDGIPNGSNPYPAPGATMWENSRLTVTNPAGQKEEYYYDGYHLPSVSWHVAHNDYQPNTGNGPSPVRTQYNFAVVGGKGRISTITYPDGTTNLLGYSSNPLLDAVISITDARGKTTTIDYNSQGQITRVQPPPVAGAPAGNGTTYNYASNGVDLLSVTNATNTLVATYTYNGFHQPVTATSLSKPTGSSTAVGNTTTYTYMLWGDVESVTDSQNHQLVYNYGTNNRVANVVFYPGDGSYHQRATYTYDDIGRVKTVTDTSGTTIGQPSLTTGYEYNLLDEVTKVVHPDGTTTEIDYAGIGLPGVIKDRSGRYSYADYDVLDRLVRTQDPQLQSLMMDYDKNGNMLRLLDSNGRSTKWVYDALNRVISKTYPDGKSEATAYSLGLVSQTANAKQLDAGQSVSYTYDERSRLKKIDYPNTNTPDVTFAYNNLDQATTINDGVGTELQTFNYDEYGRLNGLDGPFVGDAQTYSYDGYERLQSQSVGRGASGGTQSQSYTYDTLERLKTLTSNGTNSAGTVTYNYKGNTPELQELQLGNSAKVTYGYDALRRLTSVSNKNASGYNLASFTYALDDRDVRTAMGRTMATAGSGVATVNDLPQVATYKYDANDQLVDEAVNKQQNGTETRVYSNRFILDPMGNRFQLQNRDYQSGSQVSTYTNYNTNTNGLNQYTAQLVYVPGGPDTSNFTYDVAGNMTQIVAPDGSKTLYEYDDLDRLIAVEKRAANDGRLSRTEYVYDYASRRAATYGMAWNATTEAWDVSSERRQIFNGLDVIQERDGMGGFANRVTNELVRDGNIGGILAETKVTNTYSGGQYSSSASKLYLHYDGSGNVVALSDATGALVGRYVYDAFGNTLEATGPRVNENAYRFSSKKWEGGIGLYDFGYRFYSPGLGRWLNRDPIGEEGGFNLYAYVGNDPVNNVDEYGLEPFDEDGDGVIENGEGESTGQPESTPIAPPPSFGVPMVRGGSSTGTGTGVIWSFWKFCQNWLPFSNASSPTKAGRNSKPYVPPKNLSVKAKPNPPAGRSGTNGPVKRNITVVSSSRKIAKDRRLQPLPPKPGGKRVTSQTRKGPGPQNGNKSYTDGGKQRKHLHDRNHGVKTGIVVPHYTFPKRQ